MTSLVEAWLASCSVCQSCCLKSSTRLKFRHFAKVYAVIEEQIMRSSLMPKCASKVISRGEIREHQKNMMKWHGLQNVLKKNLWILKKKTQVFFYCWTNCQKILGLNFNGFETSSWQVFEFWPQDPRTFETYRINVKYLSLLECSFFKVDAVKWQHKTVLTLVINWQSNFVLVFPSKHMGN